MLAQFPISFKHTDENRAHVERIVKEFREYPLALEVRHATWNAQGILKWLAALRVGLCNIDQPLLGRAIAPSAHATAAVGYVRLHGRNYAEWFSESTNVRDRYDYLYTEKELLPWKERTEEVAAKTEQTFVVLNNHNNARAVVNALELIHLLDGRSVQAPPSLLAEYPQLAPIASPLSAD